MCIRDRSVGYRNIGSDIIAEVESIEETFYSVLKKHGFSLSEETEIENQQDKYSFSITRLLDLSKLTKIAPDEYQGTHPIHDSTTEKNFCVNTKSNEWHCFRHNSGC